MGQFVRTYTHYSQRKDQIGGFEFALDGMLNVHASVIK